MLVGLRTPASAALLSNRTCHASKPDWMSLGHGAALRGRKLGAGLGRSRYMGTGTKCRSCCHVDWQSVSEAATQRINMTTITATTTHADGSSLVYVFC